MRRTRHDVDLDSATARANQVFDDDGVLIALILQPQRMFRAVDKLPQALAAIADTPDEMRVVTRIKLRAVPVSVKALHHLFDLMFVRGEDGVIARGRKIFSLPVKRLDE